MTARKIIKIIKEDSNQMRRATSFMAMGLLLLAGFVSVEAQDTPELSLSQISIDKTADVLNVQLVIGSTVNYESFTLFNPNRLVIDLLQVTSFTCQPDTAIDAAGVLRVRAAKNQPDVTRVVFDLADTVPAYSIEENDQGLVVTFTPPAPAAEQPAEIPAEPETKAAEPETVVEKPVIKTPARTTPPPPPARETREAETLHRPRRIGINVGGGMYFVHSADFKDVYGSSAFFGGGGLSFSLPIGNHEDIGFSLDLDYITVSGETTYTAEEVKLNMMPISLTVYYLRQFGRISPYAGIGLDYFNYKEEYPDTFPVSEMSGNVLGYNVLLGTQVHLTGNLSARAYFKLHIAKKTENEIEINLSGNEYGIGLTYFFDLD